MALVVLKFVSRVFFFSICVSLLKCWGWHDGMALLVVGQQKEWD